MGNGFCHGAICRSTPHVTAENKVGVNIAGTGQLPMGDMADVTGIGVGGLGGIEVGMYPGLALTARSGYIYHFAKSDNTVYTQAYRSIKKFRLGCRSRFRGRSDGYSLYIQCVECQRYEYQHDLGFDHRVYPVEPIVLFQVRPDFKLNQGHTLFR
jgi:hypothetical protein